MKPTIKSIVTSLALATAFSMPSVQSFAAPAKHQSVKVSHVAKTKMTKGKKARKAHKVKSRKAGHQKKSVKPVKNARGGKGKKPGRGKA